MKKPSLPAIDPFLAFKSGALMIRMHGGGPKSTKFINLIPPTIVAWLLQYSGSKVEHRDEFSSHK